MKPFRHEYISQQLLTSEGFPLAVSVFYSCRGQGKDISPTGFMTILYIRVRCNVKSKTEWYFVIHTTRGEKLSGIYRPFSPPQKYNGNRSVGNCSPVRHSGQIVIIMTMKMTVPGLVCPLASDTINASHALRPYRSTRLESKHFGWLCKGHRSMEAERS